MAAKMEHLLRKWDKVDRDEHRERVLLSLATLILAALALLAPHYHEMGILLGAMVNLRWIWD